LARRVARAYALLVKAMADAGLAAVATYIMRERVGKAELEMAAELIDSSRARSSPRNTTTPTERRCSRSSGRRPKASGQAAARLFAREGAQVAVIDISQISASETATEIVRGGGPTLRTAGGSMFAVNPIPGTEFLSSSFGAERPSPR
jgi:non-homologous end joining protein Ku